MEEDDVTQSLQSPGDSLSPAPSSPLILPTSDVTVASVTKPTVSSLSPSRNDLALVVHTSSVTGGGGISGNKNGRSGGGGGGRDDCWSEEATKVLIDAWGDRFSEPGKGTLKQQHWKEVAEVVNNSRQCKYPKTDIQCKNRIDTVKKKYKQEKAKIASGDGPSRWIFFKKLENLIGGNTIIATSKSNDKAPMGVLLNSRLNQYKRQAKGTQIPQQADSKRNSNSMRWHFRKRSASETESESDPEPEPEPEPEPSPDSAESLPPPQPLSFKLPKRFKMDKTGGSEVGDVAKAILGFTEAYEKAETAKLKLMVELEKERMKFAKEMELQRMQFLKTQLEITQNNQEEERNMRGERRIIADDDHRNIKNNGDVSS